MRPTIIYDDTCKFCHKYIKRLKEKHIDKFDFIPSSSNLKTFGVTKTQAMHGIIFIDEHKTMFHKAQAIEQIYRRISRTHFFSWVRKIPFLKQLVDYGYVLVAKHRYKVFGRCDGSCQPPSTK